MRRKQCYYCKQHLPLELFGKRSASKDGHAFFCKTCRSAYNKQQYELNKQRYVHRSTQTTSRIREAFKGWRSTLKCQVCDTSFVECLDFHHVDPKSKRSEISKLLTNSSLKTLRTELEKCAVLCANCHRRFHAKTLSFLPDPLSKATVAKLVI